jgi:hypothetical protein
MTFSGHPERNQAGIWKELPPQWPNAKQAEADDDAEKLQRERQSHPREREFKRKLVMTTEDDDEQQQQPGRVERDSPIKLCRLIELRLASLIALRFVKSVFMLSLQGGGGGEKCIATSPRLAFVCLRWCKCWWCKCISVGLLASVKQQSFDALLSSAPRESHHTATQKVHFHFAPEQRFFLIETGKKERRTEIIF